MAGPRVLVTCYPQAGHLHPLVPTAAALRDAGCSVIVATHVSEHAGLALAGLDAIDIGPSHAEMSTRLPAEMPANVAALRPAERRAVLFGLLFGSLYAPAIVEPLLTHARSWRPHVILAGVESLAGPLVAARLGYPIVVSGFGTGLARDVCDGAARAVAPLWDAAGLTVPAAGGIFDGLFVDPCPPSLRPEDVALPARVQPIRPAQFDGEGNLPALPSGRPIVYVTFGTNQRFASVQRLRTIAEAVDTAGGNAVITGMEPGDLGSLPGNAVAHRFVPQSRLLPHCAAVVCHAGASTFFGALAYGTPLVVMPLSADHFANAAAGIRRGVAIPLATDADARTITIAVRRALTDHDLRATSSSVAAEIAAMPSAAEAARGILTWLPQA